ncbi:FAD-binding oxidoreductase [Pimelobacter simplex]|uniref:FAD-binding oxidoreductase n=1 Tax=Nocardioides simplex TaxID=2045 RepID=UPI001932D49B|nr:FAD-binding oxidoreductase [Pimelobacter simplex]
MDERAVRDLASSIDGIVTRPDNERFLASTRGFNLAHRHRPALVVEPANTDDIRAAIQFAGTHQLPVAVQATGHGQFLETTNALVLLTHQLSSVTIDERARTATIGAGTRWRRVLDAAAPYGLAPLSGSASTVGAIGYLLGGGVGLLARKYGFGADSILHLKMIGADGVETRVGPDQHADLFWAIRGGKSNFGIVTEVTIRLVPVSEVFAASVYLDASSIDPVLRRYADWSRSAPDDVTSSFAILRPPDAPFVPEPLRNKTVAHLRWVDCSDEPSRQHLRDLDSILAAGKAVLVHAGLRKPSDLDFVHDDPTEPCPIWERTAQTQSLSSSMIDTLLEHVGAQAASPLAMAEIRQLGGALRRQPEPPNAVAGRDGSYTMLLLGIGPPELLSAVADAGQGLLDALRPHLTGRSLMNWLGSATSPEQVRAAWEPATAARLQAIKAEVDPTNMFRFGHPIVDE